MEEREDTKMENLGSELEKMREYFRSGKTREASWRVAQLKGLLKFLKEREEDIFRAVMEDLGKHHVEAYRDEVGPLIKSVVFALKCLKGWMSGKRAPLPKVALLTSAEVVPQPIGLVLLIPSWNFPFGLSVEPMIGAIAAGNTVVLKPSELAPASSSLLANCMTTYLDSEAIKVLQGGPAIGEQLLQQRWDKIFFTGSERVGRIVMSAAIKHLTPVILELGAKCPGVVDSLSSFDKVAAVNRIVGAKYGSCAGQACIGVDYVMVEKRYAPILVEELKNRIKEMFGDNPIKSHYISRIVNKNHFMRLKNLLKEEGVQESIIYGGSMDEANQYIEPTVLLDPPLDATIMTEEIFGPLLPIITLEKIEDSIDFINLRPKPLAIYAFTKNESLKRKLLVETTSGCLVFNDAIIQYVANTLPFGGIGESGMGNYHGKYSFDAFSHYKGVVRRSFLVDFWFRFPPWNNYKLMLFEATYVDDYIGMLLVILGLKKSRHN